MQLGQPSSGLITSLERLWRREIQGGVGGAVGGLVGALVGMGIPEYEAKRYEGRVKGGGTPLSVHCDTPEQISRAKDMLKGGISVSDAIRRRPTVRHRGTKVPLGPRLRSSRPYSSRRLQ
jgi:hypothetical protein